MKFLKRQKTKDKDLLRAVKRDNAARTKAALAEGANVDAGGGSALHWASYEGYEEIVQILLDANADVHISSEQALFRALVYDNDGVVKLLLEHGADAYKLLKKKDIFDHDRDFKKIYRIASEHHIESVLNDSRLMPYWHDIKEEIAKEQAERERKEVLRKEMEERESIRKSISKNTYDPASVCLSEAFLKAQGSEFYLIAVRSKNEVAKADILARLQMVDPAKAEAAVVQGLFTAYGIKVEGEPDVEQIAVMRTQLKRMEQKAAAALLGRDLLANKPV